MSGFKSFRKPQSVTISPRETEVYIRIFDQFGQQINLVVAMNPDPNGSPRVIFCDTEEYRYRIMQQVEREP